MEPIKNIRFKNEDLVPDAWVNEESEKSKNFYVFNPSIIKVAEDRYSIVYRVVNLSCGLRKIATCQLNSNFEIIKDTITPLSDYIDFHDDLKLDDRSRTWHADPRYFRLTGKLYVTWNDGAKKPSNNQFIQEIESEGLKPIGKAKVIRLEPYVERIEKNWMFFEHDSKVYAIYSISPLLVLELDLSGESEILCSPFSNFEWTSEYAPIYGEIRGGAQPLELGNNEFLKLSHSSYKNAAGKHIYHPCFIKFKFINNSFKVIGESSGPLASNTLSYSEFLLPKLNSKVESVIYPCGQIINNKNIIISYGINDESSALAIYSLNDINKTIVNTQFSRESLNEKRVNDVKNEKESIPLFWWDAQGKLFDKSVVGGQRKFKYGNVGDIASKIFLENFLGKETSVAKKDDEKILCIGSILQNAQEGDIIWGSGIKGSSNSFINKVNNLDVYAVRGPLTLDFLRRNNIDISKVTEVFDPGVFISRIYEKEIESFNSLANESDFRIVPHYNDDLYLRRKYPKLADKFVSVDCLPLDFIASILGADKVITSSLHGIIFAESLGVPAIWLAPANGEDELKYYDYYYGTNRFNVKRCTTLEEAIRSEPMRLPVFDLDSYLNTFPKNEISNKFERKKSADGNFSKFNERTSNEELLLAATSLLNDFSSKNFFHGVLSFFKKTSDFKNSEFDDFEIVENIFEFYFSISDKVFIKKLVGEQPVYFDIVYFISKLISRSEMSSESKNNFLLLIEQFSNYNANSKLLSNLLKAFSFRIMGDFSQEKRFLNIVHSEDSEMFWSNVQRIYQFAVSTDYLESAVK